MTDATNSIGEATSYKRPVDPNQPMEVLPCKDEFHKENPETRAISRSMKAKVKGR